MSLIENRKARFNYEIIETLDAGIELFGLEVKSLRSGKGSLDGSYVIVRGNEAFLTGASIAPYQPSNTPKNYDERRVRKLLLTKEEIKKLGGIESKNGLTIVPLRVYNKGNKLKLSIGVGRGKKQFDKRQSIKKRDAEREMRRSLKYE